jgi:NADP-dependent 3-hydroxy acid dehydrogenase YdfG
MAEPGADKVGVRGDEGVRSIIVVGAGPGLGLAVARRFGLEKYRVGLIARRRPALDLLAERLAEDGIDAVTAAGDVGYTGSLHAALDKLTAEIGVPDVLVFNPAALAPGRPSTIDSTRLLAALATNVGGLVDTVQRVIQPMRVRRYGTVLVTGGGLAIDPLVDAVGLAVGKAAQRNFVHALSREVIDDDVQVSTVMIRGQISPDTAFDAGLIADAYWRVHTRPRADWTWETPYDPTPED